MVLDTLGHGSHLRVSMLQALDLVAHLHHLSGEGADLLTEEIPLAMEKLRLLEVRRCGLLVPCGDVLRDAFRAGSHVQIRNLHDACRGFHTKVGCVAQVESGHFW